MIVDEVNYYKKIYNEQLLDKKYLIKTWTYFDLTGKMEEEIGKSKPKPKL